jgi:6-pyruvoyl-tetrahydropterin synthase
MYSLTVSDHFMVAHSLTGAVFGPAQAMHGATFIVEATFFRPTLDPDNIVVDIGRAQALLREVLAELNYQNLDEHPKLSGHVTTTEFLAHHIFERLGAMVRDGGLGQHAQGINSLKVTLAESPIARASYEGPLGI